MSDADELAAWIIKNADKRGTPQFDEVVAGLEATQAGRAYNAGLAKQASEITGPRPTWLEDVRGGVASAPIAAYLGLKQLAGGLNENEQSALAQNKVAANRAPWMSALGGVGTAAPTMLIPGANTASGGAAIGAVTNALTTPGDLGERAKMAMFGGIGGGIGGGLAGVAGAAQPRQVNPNVRFLQQEGVGLTPGQNAGGILKAYEDKATSIPLLGDVINNARRRGIEDYNRAEIRQATLPGMNVQGVGHDAIQDLRLGLGNAYDNVLATSHVNINDPQYVAQMASLRALTQGMPKKESKAFGNIIEREIGGRTSPSGYINAENLQSAKSGLGKQIENFSTSNDAYQRQLGQALKEADAELIDLVRRLNPQNADELRAIDSAYANFKRIQRAGSVLGADQGVFTPAQMLNAARALDKSKDKRAFSEGTALMQDLAMAGKDVMPSKVPDSGTAGRGMANLFSLGGIASTAGGAAAAIPALIAYSRPGSTAINSLVNNAMIPTQNALMRAFANNRALPALGQSLPGTINRNALNR